MLTLEQLSAIEPTESAVWRRARQDWEDGVSVAEICDRYGLARSTAYQRVQGWRAEGRTGGGAADEALDPAWEPPGSADLARLAWRRLAQAVQNGRVYEALGWRSLAEALDKVAAKEAWAARLKTDDPKVLAAELLSPAPPRPGPLQTPAPSPALSMAEVAVRSAACEGKLSSLDTPLPLDSAALADEAPPAGYDAASVKEWRTWAVLSEHLEAKQRAGATARENGEPDEEEAGIDLEASSRPP